MSPSCGECDDYYSQLSHEGAVVIFVVKKTDNNFVDQRMLEFGLWENHRCATTTTTAVAYSAPSVSLFIRVGLQCHLNVCSVLMIESRWCECHLMKLLQRK